MIRSIIMAELRDHPGKAIAAGVAAVLVPFVVIGWLWVIVPTIRSVLRWMGVPA